MSKLKRRIFTGVMTMLFALFLAQNISSSGQVTHAATLDSGSLRMSSSINQYIVNNHLNTPQITKELHQFAMFNYKTSDKRPNGIVFHQTADYNSFSAREGANYEINYGWQTAFVHTFIDAASILNIHDTDYGCWGAGPMANARFVQFELVTARNKREFAQSINNSAWYTAYICHLYGIPLTLASQHYGVGGIWTHNDVTHYLGGTDHTDPTGYLKQWGYTLPEFLDLVQAYTRTQHFADTMSALKTVDYDALVNQTDRNDGMFLNAPYNVDGSSFAAYAKQYQGQTLHAVAEVTTQSATWVKVQLPDGRLVWMDKRGVKKFDRIKTQKTVNYPVKIEQADRQDMLFSNSPYNTLGSKGYQYASTFDGQMATAIVEGIVGDQNLTWLKIRLADGTEVWIDKRGVHAYDVLTNLQNTNYEAKITTTTAQDGLFNNQPYNVLGSSLYKLAQAYKNEDVHVEAEAQTGATKWARVVLSDSHTVWINAACLTPYAHLEAEKTVNYHAKIAKATAQDGLFTNMPYSVAGSQLYALTLQYANKDVTVTREAMVGSIKWAKITLSDGKSVWVDEKCLAAYPEISVVNTTEYKAKVAPAKANDAFFAYGPYQTYGSKQSDAVTAHLGEQVIVKQEVKVAGVAWLQVQLSDNRLMWIDKRLIQLYPEISVTSTAVQMATITSATTQDGLFLNNPYNTADAQFLAMVQDYLGQTVEIQKTANVSSVAWDQVKLTNGQLVWLNAHCVAPFDQLTITSMTSYNAKFVNPKSNDGLFVSQPYGVYGSAFYRSAIEFADQKVTVLKEGTTKKATWAYVRLADGTTVWVDKRILAKV